MRLNSRSIGSSGSFSFFMCVRKRLALTENTSRIGTRAAQFANVAASGRR
jgi:hypothetical protein